MATLRFIVYAALIYLSVGVFYWVEQERFLFPISADFARSTPADVNLNYEDLRIPSGQAGSVHAWWIAQSGPGAKTLIVFHGNGYTLGDMVFGELPALRRTGANLLLADYRGYGLSSPIRPNEATIFADAEAVLGYLLHSRRIPAGEVFVLGRSIGSGPATYLAAKSPQLGGLILESPFSSIDDAARSVGYLRVFPLGLMLRTHFDNFSSIASVSIPVLIATGSDDTLTPPAMARKLFDRARQPKQLILIPHAGHNDLTERGGEALEAALRAFVK